MNGRKTNGISSTVHGRLWVTSSWKISMTTTEIPV